MHVIQQNVFNQVLILLHFNTKNVQTDMDVANA